MEADGQTITSTFLQSKTGTDADIAEIEGMTTVLLRLPQEKSQSVLVRSAELQIKYPSFRGSKLRESDGLRTKVVLAFEGKVADWDGHKLLEMRMLMSELIDLDVNLIELMDVERGSFVVTLAVPTRVSDIVAQSKQMFQRLQPSINNISPPVNKQRQTEEEKVVSETILFLLKQLFAEFCELQVLQSMEEFDGLNLHDAADPMRSKVLSLGGDLRSMFDLRRIVESSIARLELHVGEQKRFFCCVVHRFRVAREVVQGRW